nr:phage portal protein [uncultured Mediterranean phage uvMED]
MADNSRTYPSGTYGPGSGPPEENQLNGQAEAGNDPSWLSGPYLEMSEWWQPILVCMGGTQAFRENAETLLPIEPREDDQAWRRRVSHAVLSPFLTRLADQAAGLICRKPITLQPREEGQEVDEYWEEFIKDVDGYGTSLDAFAREVVLHSLLLGHSAVLVDFPSTEPAANLREERELGLRPYFLEVRADQILGWRKDGDSPLAKVNQVRINEYVTEPLGAFGDRVIRQIRVLEQGRWSTWRKGDNGWFMYEEGTTSLPVIPLAVTYSGKLSELMSKPPLLPVANLNILHSQRQADLQHALHVAALPVMYLKGFDDNGDDAIGLSANSAILLPTDGDVGYAEPASSAFDSQQGFVTELENQMRNLGISTLFNQTYVGETAEAKAMDRSDSDSMLSVVAQDLEKALQNALDIAGAYVSRETPLVSVARDFDLQKLDSGQVGQYMSMWTQGAISHQLLLEMLQRGEILPDIDIEAEIELIESTKLEGMDLAAAGGNLAEEDKEDGEEQPAEGDGEDSEIRQEVLKRLRRLTGDDESDEDSD